MEHTHQARITLQRLQNGLIDAQTDTRDHPITGEERHLAPCEAVPGALGAAFAMRGDEERVRAAGCDACIARPFSYRIFLATIAALLAAGPDPQGANPR